MNLYLHAGLRALVWSIGLALIWNYLIQRQNPFVGSVLTLLVWLIVLVDLFSLRRKGWRYVGTFLLGLIACSSLLVWADNAVFDHHARYYTATSVPERKK